MKTKNGFIKNLRYLCLISIIALGVITIVGCNGGNGDGTTEVNTPPTATITSPSDGSTYTQGDTISFSGTGADAEDGALTGSSLVWTSSIDGQIGTGSSFTKSDLSAGTHTITLTATDSEGATDTGSVSITVEPLNTSPTATITSPTDGRTYIHGDTISFSGTGADAEGGAITGSSLVWTSSIDGQIGTGSSFTKSDLSVGTHTITLTATDSEGATGTGSVTVSMTEAASWMFTDGWWREPQVWAFAPGAEWDDASVIASFDFAGYEAMNVSVVSWLEGSQVAVNELHSRGYSVVGYNGMLGMFQPDRTDPWLFWDEDMGIFDFTMDEPEELAPAIMIDPFGNLTYSHIFGFSEEVQFLQYSVPHPLYQEYMTEHMKNLIDAGVDGYLIDELAYGSVDLPDFNPHTLEEFKRFLEQEFEPSDLQALLESVGVDDLASFDYAALVREQLPPGTTELSMEDWTVDLPLFALFRRFLALQNYEAVAALLESGREYAAETAGKEIPFSANINILAAPDSFLIIPLLDMIDLEFFYLDFGYFRNGRGIAPLKLTRYFDKSAMLCPSVSAHEDLVAWGAAGTIDIYGTMIADAVSSGGEFHVVLGVGPMDGPIEQDIDALAPYYRFRTDHPDLFDDLEPLEPRVAVLHLWENVLTDAYWTKAYFGICSLLADAGVQFDTVFGAQEYLMWGEMPMYPAPDFPLDVELLRTYPVLVIPELNDLIESHAWTLLDYIDGGGVIVTYCEDDVGLEYKRVGDPGVASLLQMLRSGSENEAGGKVVHLDENLARNYSNDPDPALRQEWLNVMADLGLNPEVRYDAGPMVAAQVYAAEDQLVVHFVNYNWDIETLSTTPISDIRVEIVLPAGFNREGVTASIHAPGQSSVSLNVEASVAGIIVTIPELHIWSVISIAAAHGLSGTLDGRRVKR